ncbi:MAG: terminase family protein [Alphaproteobacteria bacterium]|nr:terminase family protein [Alphaproteobacteria bacterium]
MKRDETIFGLCTLADDVLLAEFRDRCGSRRLEHYRPYPWQAAFHEAGAANAHRIVMAANRVGKTLCAAMEAAMHAAGRYPTWWRGRRFPQANLGWACGITSESVRDIVQKELLGPEDEHGSGTLPGDALEKVTYRRAGVSDVVDVIRVRHTAGGLSLIVLKSYDQGWRKYQGAAPDWIWLDEEPDDFRVFTECITRLLTSRGTLMVTFTPLLGETDLVRYFLNPAAGGIHLTGASWDDAPHLDRAARAQLEAAMPEHERQARITGAPMLGSGRVFAIAEGEIVIDPIELPGHFPRICGVDFGIDHPFAAVWLAWDRDADCVFLYDEFRRANEVPAVHAEAIKRRGAWIPVSWPGDGLQRDKGSGQALRDLYFEHGLSMLPKPASYGDARGRAVEPGVLEMLERMRTGRWKVFRTCAAWLEEFRAYHRKDGRIVKHRDDAISASRYALMAMARHATTKPTAPAPGRARGPILSTRL